MFIEENLVDQVWEEQPAPSSNPVLVLEEKYAGRSVKDKLFDLRLDLEKIGAHAFVVTALDEIAWLLNIRGSDIPHNPVVLSYCLLTSDDCVLFIDENKLSESSYKHLQSEGVSVKPYESVFVDLSKMNETMRDNDFVLMDPAKTSYAIYNCFNSSSVILDSSPVEKRKAIKNSVELQGFRNCHRRDGVAKVPYLLFPSHSIH